MILVSFVFLTNVRGSGLIESCPDGCRCIETRMVCETQIPGHVPSNVTCVELYAVNMAEYASDPPFNKTAWEHITELFINVNEFENGTTVIHHDAFTLRSKTFYQLQNLQHLSFINSNVQNMEPGTFAGVSGLETLNFKGNVNLRISDFIVGLRDHNLSNLTSLRLCNISQSRGVANFFGADFFGLLSHTKLKHLDLSYIDSAIMDTPSFATSLPYLEEIVFEHAGYLGINIFKANMDNADGAVYRTLRKININYSTIPPSIFKAAELLNSNTYIGYDAVPNNFTSVRARACVPETVPSLLFGVKFTSCLGVVMSFPVVSVNWTIFCLPYHPDDGLYLEELDIAENGIEYFHPSLTTSATRLRSLDVSFNRLFKMEYQDFGRMVQNCPDLRTLVLSHNQLVAIPYEMFANSRNLETLYLSHNNLKHVDFDTSGLLQLEFLDMSHNSIASLDSSMRGRLDNLIVKYQSQKSINKSEKLHLLLHNNPLECSCETVEFEGWVIQAKTRCNVGDVRCHYKEAEVSLTESVYEESEFECKLVIIYAVVGSVSGVCVLVLIVFSVKCVKQWHRKAKQRRLESVISKYKASCNTTSSQPIPVFLSHSGADEEFVSLNILSQMNNCLQSMLCTSGTCVTTGDSSFRPGQYVAEEIIRCIEGSRVIVACVSQQFCKSHWCRNEIVVSQMENKPLVLLFLEHVKTDSMPRCLRTPFNKTTRCKVHKSETGEVSLQPDMETICESILQLMTKNNEHRESVKTDLEY